MHSRHPRQRVYDIREFRPGDEASLLATFNRVFGDLDPEFVPRTPAQWAHTFEDNPAGRRVYLALKEGEVVAQYAALPTKVWIAGEERVFCQIVDSMVHPEHRAGLKRPGLFVETGRAFFEAFGGRRKDLVFYGWPIAEAWRVGKRFLDYEVVRTHGFLAMPPGAGAAPPAGVEKIERFDEQSRWLYDRCVGDWGASTVRDPEYLNWRFVDNPYHDYEVFGARDADGVLRGYAVYRLMDWIVSGMGLIVDWLVPPDEVEVGERLLAAVQARAKADGATVAATVVPDVSPWFGWFQRQGFRVHPSDYFMVARNFHRRYDMDWLRRYWWYQLSDTDLV